jgi:hypothetical protein
MSNCLKTTETLPLTGCTRADIESLIETVQPDTGMADGTTLQVLNDTLAAMNAVPRWTKTTVGYSSVVALGAVLTGQISLNTVPDGAVILAVRIMSKVQWVGSTATLVADVGTAGSATKYLTGYNLLTAPATDQYQLATTAGSEQTTVAGNGSGTVLKLRVTGTGANLDTVSAGSVTVWVLWSATDA